MAELFERRVKVLIAVPSSEDFHSVTADVYEIERLRVQFKVKKTLTKHANTGEISITNLSESSRARLQAKGLKVVLQAGYADTLATIFVGDVRYVDHKREGADWTTKIQCGDGERGLRYARVSESFGPGIKIPKLIKKIGDKMGLGIGNLERQANRALRGKQLEHGHAAHGPAASEMDRVLRAYGLEWSVQDGDLQILAPGQATTELAVTLTPQTGLIGSPEMTSPEKNSSKKKPALKVRSLLQPGLRPGRRVVVQSEGRNGTFLVKQVEHTGDTAGGDWYSDLECDVHAGADGGDAVDQSEEFDFDAGEVVE